MFELLKIVLEEPEKIRKTGLFVIRAILNLIIASSLYENFIGEYNFIDILDIEQWAEFILSGRVLIGVLFYIISEIIFFHLLSAIFIGYLDYKANKSINSPAGRYMHSAVLFLFRITKAFEFDEKEKRLKLSKNTDSLSEFLEFYLAKESKNEIYNLKHQFANNIVHTYFIFAICYFLYFDLEGKNWWLNTIIILFCFLLPMAYISICELLNYFDKHSKEIQYTINGMKFEKIIRETLGKNGIFLSNELNPRESKYHYSFRFGKNEYILQFFYAKISISERELQTQKEVFLKANKKMLFVTNVELTENALEFVKEHKNSLIVISFKDENDLVTQLETSFKRK